MNRIDGSTATAERAAMRPGFGLATRELWLPGFCRWLIWHLDLSPLAWRALCWLPGTSSVSSAPLQAGDRRRAACPVWYQARRLLSCFLAFFPLRKIAHFPGHRQAGAARIRWSGEHSLADREPSLHQAERSPCRPLSGRALSLQPERLGEAGSLRDSGRNGPLAAHWPPEDVPLCATRWSICPSLIGPALRM